MRANTLAATLSLCAAITPFDARSQAAPMEWQRQVATIANGFKAAAISDRGDGSHILRLMQNPKCGRSAHDGEDRDRRLARYYSEVIEALISGDADRIYATSLRLHDQVDASSMYQSCWHTMIKQGSHAGEIGRMVGQIVQLGPNPNGAGR